MWRLYFSPRFCRASWIMSSTTGMTARTLGVMLLEVR
jgi:hypothetical protein